MININEIEREKGNGRKQEKRDRTPTRRAKEKAV